MWRDCPKRGKPMSSGKKKAGVINVAVIIVLLNPFLAMGIIVSIVSLSGGLDW
jgi:hypothetical protein